MPVPDTPTTPPVPDADLWRFGEGTHDDVAAILGAHLDDAGGTVFRVWAPSAAAVSVVGRFNDWAEGVDPLTPSAAGIWSGRVADANVGDRVRIQETRPLSKKKRWRLVEIIERAR